MKVLGIDPDSQIGPALDRHALATHARLRVVPARRMGEALAHLEHDREINCCFIDARVAAQDEHAFLKLLAQRFAAVPVVVIAEAPSPDAVRSYFSEGVRGIIPRALSLEDMLRALRIVADGGFYVPPDQGPAASLPLVNAWRPRSPELTPRQREVLALLAQGHLTPEICARLGLTQGTVKNHLGAIYRQLRVHNRLQAVVVAARHLEVMTRSAGRSKS